MHRVRPQALSFLLPALCVASAWAAGIRLEDGPAARHKAGAASITEDEVDAHVRYLASPKLEGRNTPSGGLDLAARHVAAVFAEAGLAPAPDWKAAWDRDARGAAIPDWSHAPGVAGAAGSEAEENAEAGGAGTYLRPWVISQGGRRDPLTRPEPDDCALELAVEGEDAVPFAYGTDFVPVPFCEGDVRGELVFAGFGISSKTQKYDDFRGQDLEGKVALVLEGEPRHRKRFKGPEVTAEASYWNKLDKIRDEKVAGVIFVRRAPAKAPRAKQAPEPAPLSYRYSPASWSPPSTDRRRGDGPPAIEVTEEVASRLLGKDVGALAAQMDKSARPKKVKAPGRLVSFRSASSEGGVVVYNVVGAVPGTDPVLKDEWVVVGAHYDHIGVGPRGRIGFGADDNASGTSALLEIVGAMGAAGPRRSVLFCAFSGEEKGLLGSKAIAANLPVEKGRIVAMVNLDMVGYGEKTEVCLLGFEQYPPFEKLVKRANKVSKTGVRKLTPVNDAGIYQRSDQYSFHEVGIPSLFITEGYPISKNKDYHTYRDTPDTLDMKKIANTARFGFNVAWVLAQEDDPLPARRR